MIIKIAKIIFDLLPAKNKLIYSAFRRYCDRYNGENNSDMQTNGELKFMGMALSDASTVFDVGANVGDWAKKVLEINKTVSLHCFEPSADTFKLLLKNNFPKNVSCLNYGLGSEPGTLTLHIFEEGSGMNSLFQREGIGPLGIKAQSKEEKIQLVRLDDYCLENNVEYIDFLKIDVEGYELESFKGMKNILENGNIGIIQFEYGGCNIDARVLLKDIWEFFSGYDYTFFKLYYNGPIEYKEYCQKFENFNYQNWAIIRNDLKCRFSK